MFHLDFRGSDQLDIIVAQTLVDSMFVKNQAAQSLVCWLQGLSHVCPSLAVLGPPRELRTKALGVHTGRALVPSHTAVIVSSLFHSYSISFTDLDTYFPESAHPTLAL